MTGKKFAPPVDEFCQLWDAETPLIDMAIRYATSITAIRNYAVSLGLANRRVRVNMSNNEQWFPLPCEIEQEKLVLREKHFSEMRAETDEMTRSRLSKQRQQEEAHERALDGC